MSESIKNHEATVMRMVGNLLSEMTVHYIPLEDEDDIIYRAVRRARKIVAEVQRTAPTVDPTNKA